VERETVKLHQHAQDRLIERGATESEVIATVKQGETFPAKHGRTGFRRNFPFNGLWRGKHYATKQIEAYAIKEDEGWLVITVVVRYF
jgi:hypothetical protein